MLVSITPNSGIFRKDDYDSCWRTPPTTRIEIIKTTEEIGLIKNRLLPFMAGLREVGDGTSYWLLKNGTPKILTARPSAIYNVLSANNTEWGAGYYRILDKSFALEAKGWMIHSDIEKAKVALEQTLYELGIKHTVDVNCEFIGSKIRPIFGIELEGGWRKKPDNLVGDGSVSDNLANYCGEVRIGPSRKEALLKNMFSQYPDCVNGSCGMHLHTSFPIGSNYRSDDSLVEMSPGGYISIGQEERRLVNEYVDEAVRSKWEHQRILERSGKLGNIHSYTCSCLSPVDIGLKGYCNSRYVPINTESLERHGTIEFRFPPMGRTKEEGVQMTDYLCSQIEKLESRCPKWTLDVRLEGVNYSV